MSTETIPNTIPTESWLSFDEAAELLGIPVADLRKQHVENQLPYGLTNNAAEPLFHRGALENWKRHGMPAKTGWPKPSRHRFNRGGSK